MTFVSTMPIVPNTNL